MNSFSQPASHQTRTTAADAPLHIGFFADTYAPQINGISVSLQLLVQGLRAEGHEVTIFAPRFPHYHDLDENVHRIPAVPYTQSPPFYVAVPGTPRTSLALGRCHFDILHVHSPLSTGVLAYLTARAKHTPLVYTYHTAITDYVHYLKFGGNTRPARKAARWFSTRTANLADRVVTPSDKIRDLLIHEHVSRPIHTISNGIDLQAFHQATSSGTYRRQLGLAPTDRLLISVGRLAPEKHLDLLVDAFAHIAARLPDAHLVFAGDGSSRADLEKQAAAGGYADRIHFLGMVDRPALPGLLREANLFLSASTTETQCVAMVEAIASELPVVALWDAAFTGMLVDGLNGLCAPRDTTIFADLVCSLLADPQRLLAFGKNSLELSRKFSIEAQVTALLALYRETIREKSDAQLKRISSIYPLTRSTF